MADVQKTILSVVATTASRLPDLSIKNGRLIFVKDSQKVALDLNDKRTFFNQIVVLQTDLERQSLLAPISGLFYFVIDTAVLWHYEQSWIQITRSPNEIIYIGVSLPELGSANSLYVNTSENNISVWNDSEKKYQVVADKAELITDDDIMKLFE